MSMERRKLQIANQRVSSLTSRRRGQFEGYKRLEWISSAARRLDEKKMGNLMHHFNSDNLSQAFRKLSRSSASGIDHVTKDQYGKNLCSNITALEGEIRRGGWRPKPSREILIPKANGGKRAIAVGCLEDKIVQLLAAKILEAIFEPLFDYRSYGFRYGKSQHQALAKIYDQIRRYGKNCVVVDIDLKAFFDSIDHDKLMEYIETRIQDAHFLRLIRRMLRNSILNEKGEAEENTLGTPQGSPISPVLANIYLHFVIDEWFCKKWDKHGQFVRYADDIIFIFEENPIANKFKKALKRRLKSEGKIEMNEDKSKVVSFSKHKPQGNVSFLGFTLYWGKYACKRTILKVKTSAKAFSKSIQAFKVWIKRMRNRLNLDQIWSCIQLKLTGYYNYYGVTFNLSKLNQYYFVCMKELFKWLNRRSQKRSFTYERFERRLFFKPLPKPRSERLLDITLGII